MQMNNACTATAAVKEGGRHEDSACDAFSSTSKRDQPDLFEERASDLFNTECTEALKNESFPVFYELAKPDVVPGLQAVLHRVLREGPTALSSLKADIRASTQPWTMYLGDVDFCVKPDRPDGVQDTLGLTVLDEPAALASESDVLLLRLRTCLPSIGGNELSNCPSLNSRFENAQTLRQDVDAWLAAVKSHHGRLVECAKAAGLESASSAMLAHTGKPVGVHINCALQKQFLFCISELPMLSLSVENLARVICWLAGVPSIHSVNSPLPELLALFSLCLEALPSAPCTSIDKQRLMSS